jgi:hypothetical protein
MLKEIFTQSDEECLDSLMSDIRYQYALHTTSFNERPVSKNSITNFRTAFTDITRKKVLFSSGKNLYGNCRISENCEQKSSNRRYSFSFKKTV